MKKAGGKGTVGRKRLGRVLALMAFVLLILFLPDLLRLVVNRKVLPDLIADPAHPLAAGMIDRLDYTGLTAKDVLIDAGNGLQLGIPSAEVEYTPLSLIRKQLRSASANITSGKNIEFEAKATIRDACFSSAGVSAGLTATCSVIRANGFEAGPFSLSTRLEGTNVAFAFDLPLQEGLLTARIAMDAQWKPSLAFNAQATLPILGTDGAPLPLGKLVPGMTDLSVAGEAKASISGNADGMDATVSLTISHMESPERKLSVDNLETACALRFPGAVRSLPEQQLTAERLTVGQLQFDRLRMHYQLEPESVLFIEACEAQWCGGRASLYNTRYRPRTNKAALQLFCDRLSLEQVLSAFGLKNFSAGGELNGRLPLSWNAGALSIDHGFLFTTPGHGGTFAFDSVETAAGILPLGSVEEGQIGLVASALKEFNYDWITMTLNSEGDSLLAVIEASGQPARVLPYEYDSKRGSYVKVELRPGRGTRQPMHFQLNLTIPLNQLLCYGSGFNRQWNQFKTNL